MNITISSPAAYRFWRFGKHGKAHHMSHSRAIFRIFLLAAFVCASLPLQMLEDAHFDGNIDLKDAIFAVRQFEGSAVNTGLFSNSVRAAVASLEIAADLKTVIKTDQNRMGATAQSLAPATLFGSSGIAATETAAFTVRDIPDSFTSIDTLPPTPPPKLV